MQQRRVRLGDILDDYCPRERRVTNHAVVAMIDDEVKQTRCTTCDADHPYKHAKVPKPRRKAAAPAADLPAAGGRPRPAHAPPAPPPPAAEEAPAAPPEGLAADAQSEGPADDEWPVHRRLIRATLPRPEGQAPERKPPDFTFRPAGGRFDNARGGHRARVHRPGGHAHAHGQPTRFGGPRHGPGRDADGNRFGNRQPHGGFKGGDSGHRRGPRHGSGSGRKRGR
jgi:hypothetical protein